MKNPFQKVSEFIKRHAMLDGARGVLVAVSGGADSVALLDMLARLLSGDKGLVVGGARTAESKRLPPTRHPHLHVAHLNHMLRGRESTEDAEFVRALAGRLGLRSAIGSADVRAAASDARRGVEEIAREIRYDFLRAAAKEAGCDRIAVGHTMTDQAETFLMRLVRGAGLRGLAAMRPVGEVPTGREGDGASRGKQSTRQTGEKTRGSLGHPVAPSPPLAVSLIRPLLCITREEVELYCDERGLEFRTDVTNLSRQYTRNRLRNDVLPALRSINPRVVEAISRAAGNSGDDQDVLNNLASWLLTNARIASGGGRHLDGGVAGYRVAAFLEQPVGIRRRMIIEAIRLARSGVICEGIAAGEVGSAHVAAIERLLASNASGKRIALPGLLEVWREFDALVLKPEEREPADSVYPISIGSSSARVVAGGFDLRIERGLPIESLASIKEETLREKQRTGRDWLAVALDDCALPDGLIIRPRVEGERAHVIGRRRTIKLKNLMIDHRIPSSRRALWPLVTTPDGAYVWSPGLPPALGFAAHNETSSLAIMRALAL